MRPFPEPEIRLPCAFVAGILLLLSGRPHPVAGQDAPVPCEGGRISHIFVDNHSVFDVDDLEDERPFQWAYELVNTFHVRTSEDFIRDELLVRVGDCYDPMLIDESERLLRNYGFIARADAYGLEQPDGSWHVVVDTQDEWTTKVNVNVSFDGGFELRGADITEENLLGEGLTAGVFFRRRDEQRDLGARFFSPQLFGTRMDASLAAGRTRVGDFFEQSFFYPFVGEVGRVAGRQVYLNRDELFPYRLPGSDDIVLMPVEEERIEIMLAGRLGEPGNLTLIGLGISNETLEFPGFPGNVEVAPGGDFGNLEPAPPALVEPLRSQTLHSSATRLSILLGQRNVTFVQRAGLDALRGIQDVPVGMDLGLTLGRSIAPLSAGGNQPDDMYTRIRLFGGSAPGRFLVQLNSALEGRQIFAGGGNGDGWRDLLAEGDLLLYWQPGGTSPHTLLARAAAAGGWDLNMPYQLTLGGPAGVRGYDEDQIPGGRRMVFTVEDRIALGWPFPDLFDFGLTVFGDAGRMWAGGAPFGSDSGWKAAVGAGLRIGFPTGTRGVVRVDAAFPLENGAGLGDLVLRISMGDPVGLAAGFLDEQLQRSRRITVGPDVFTPARR